MAAAAPPPDGGCQQCPAHSGIVAIQENHGRDIHQLQTDLSVHCNGGGNHPSRREVDDLAEQVHENSKRIDAQRDARITRSDKIEMGIIMAIISSAIAALSTLIK